MFNPDNVPTCDHCEMVAADCKTRHNTAPLREAAGMAKNHRSRATHTSVGRKKKKTNRKKRR